MAAHLVFPRLPPWPLTWLKPPRQNVSFLVFKGTIRFHLFLNLERLGRPRLSNEPHASQKRRFSGRAAVVIEKRALRLCIILHYIFVSNYANENANLCSSSLRPVHTLSSYCRLLGCNTHSVDAYCNAREKKERRREKERSLVFGGASPSSTIVSSLSGPVCSIASCIRRDSTCNPHSIASNDAKRRRVTDHR